MMRGNNRGFENVLVARGRGGGGNINDETVVRGKEEGGGGALGGRGITSMMRPYCEAMIEDLRELFGA